MGISTKTKYPILIVDDEPDILEVLKMKLDGLTDEILEAGDGKAALDLVMNNDVVCIVSDIKMPVMDGIEFLRQIRDKGYKTPLLFLTGYMNDENIHKALEYGAYDFVNKTFVKHVKGKVEDAIKVGEKILGQGGANIHEDDFNDIMEKQNLNNFMENYFKIFK